MRRTIRILAVLPVAVALVAAAAANADAAERTKKKYRASGDPAYEYDRTTGERVYSRPDRNGWYPRDSNKLKFGSRIWWEQMERDGRLGQREW